MKKLSRIMSISLLAACCVFLCSAAEPTAINNVNGQSKPLKIVVVNFKDCVEKSKMGQKEQANFDSMKKQMETILLEKEKSLNDIASKFNDIDYLDSLSPEAETKLKDEFRRLNTEFNQQQNQFYQTLSQTNLKVVQKLTDAITKASGDYAKKNKIDIVLNEEGCFFIAPALNISDEIVKVLDATPEVENKEAKSGNSLLDSLQ